MNKHKDLRNPNQALGCIAKELNEGDTALFLGAGTSIAFGFPNWISLGNKIRERADLIPDIIDSCSASQIQKKIDDALIELKVNEREKIDLVRDILYDGQSGLDNEKVFKYPLLIALSLLLSRKAKTVVSFNYDGMLEWFMSLFGLNVQPVISLPEQRNRADIDIKIYHPHGYIKHPMMNGEPSKSDFLILGHTDTERRTGGDSEWRSKLVEIMRQNMCIFVGMSHNSLEDPVLGPYIRKASETIEGREFLGYWLLADKTTDDQYKDFESKKIIPVMFSDYKKIPPYILEISQTAMKLKNKV